MHVHTNKHTCNENLITIHVQTCPNQAQALKRCTPCNKINNDNLNTVLRMRLLLKHNIPSIVMEHLTRDAVLKLSKRSYFFIFLIRFPCPKQ